MSYFSQDIISYDSTVREYIKKGRTDITDEKILKCLGELNAEELLLDMNIKNLSGGEKVKVAIAATLLKNTPYIFLDEPTNNLDNKSVEDLCKVLKNHAKNHTIIIVSHDNRIILENCKYIKVKNNTIVQEYEKGSDINVEYPSNIDVDKRKMFFNIVRSKVRTAGVFLIIVMIIMAMYLNNYNYSHSLSTGSNDIPQGKMIVAYMGDMEYSDLNRVYCDEKSIDIAEEKYYSTISFDDIKSIADMNEVEKIIILNDSYYYKVISAMQSGTMSENVVPISQPEDISEYSYNYLGYGNKSELITKGRYPADGRYEAAVSEQILKKHYNYTDKMLKGAIGDKILVDGEMYKIVGFTALDTYILSYSSDKDYGYYEYNSETFDAFTEKLKEFRNREEYYLQDETEVMYIYTKGSEEKLLDMLMKEYPAQNYNSKVYSEVWIKGYDKPIILKSILINCILSLLLANVILSINAGTVKLQAAKLKDYENYYLGQKKEKKYFVLSYVMEFIVVIFIMLVISFQYTSYPKLICIVQAIDLAIVYMPIIILVIYEVYIKGRKSK